MANEKFDNQDEENKVLQDKMMKKFFVKQMILDYGTIFFALLSTLCLHPYPLVALILAECAHIYFRATYTIFYIHDSLHNKIRGFFTFVAPGAIAVVVAMLAVAFIGESDQSTVDFITQIVAGVLLVPLIVPILKSNTYLFDDKRDDKFVFWSRKLTQKQMRLLKSLTVAYRVIMILGLVLTIFNIIALALVGFGFWAARQTLTNYYLWKCEVVTSADREANYNTEQQINGNSTADGGERALNEREVREIIRKIADRWSYKSDSSIMCAGVSINYRVTCELSGYSYISYTVNGELHGVRDNYESEAYTFAQSKLSDVAQKISMETQNELSKKKLAYTYDITVNIGNITDGR